MAQNLPLKTLKKAAPRGISRLKVSGIFENWALWGMGALMVTVFLGGISTFSLITQPSKPNCKFVFWPFAPGSVRLYCAQELAQDPSLENLLEAIELVDTLGENHPLRGAINPRIEAWSKLALDKAEASFHAGNMKRAIEFAQKIPDKTAAAKLVKERIAKWRKIWAEGEAINDKVESAFDAESWRKAFGHMVKFLYVDNRYWSQTRYEEVTDKIIQAQKDEKKVVKAEALVKSDGYDNLEKALKLVREISDSSIFKKSITKIFDSVAKKMIAIAEKALNAENLSRALDALSLIPKESQYWESSRALSTIANASSLTWGVSSDGYIRAIEELAEIPKDNLLFNRAQGLIRQWKAEIGIVKVLEEAQLKALSGDISDLRAAIASARSIPNGSDHWEQAQDNIAEWKARVERTEDQPILDYADDLSISGDVSALESAIVQAQKISSGRSLYSEAQSRIEYWQSRIKDLTYVPTFSPPSDETAFSPSETQLPPEPQSTSNEPQPERSLNSGELILDAQALAREGTPENLASAIKMANRVPLNSIDRYEAEIEIENWATQLLNLAISEAQADPEQAIALASKIPSFSQNYNQAQGQIVQWKAQLNTANDPPPNP